MSPLYLILLCWVMLILTFVGHFMFPQQEEHYPERETLIPSQPRPVRFSGNAHDRRIQRRRADRRRKLAAGQTPTRGARGRWATVNGLPCARSYANAA